MIDESLLARFERARELDAEARARFLDEIERVDAAAASDLRSLLLADGTVGSLLERPVVGVLASPTGEAGAVDAPEPGIGRLPERVGPYRIVREIGRGGMGRVFLGEHEGEGFRRAVAVKRLDRGDPSPLAARRFRDEVRILSALEHPGIARFLDGGRDVEGVAYLALEYVEGVDLVTHATPLPIAERLRLFLEVLGAVEYAHEQRVVHRDLKPGNILVGVDGHPKLLDFGISKLLDAEGEESAVTRTEQRALTPAYASPEQIAGASATVASDVYSLGVILYELLAGERPFERASASVRELEAAIREQEPEPPSTVARRRTRSTRVAAATATSPTTPRLGRDLDAICLKALRKQPEERYSSARELAADLERFLDGRPVAARRGGTFYRFGKRLRRMRGTLATALVAAAVAAILVHLTTRGDAAGRRQLAAPPERPTLPPIGELSARFAAEPMRPELGLELARAYLDAGRGADAMGAVTRLRQLPGDLGKSPAIDLAEAEASLALSEHQRAAALAVAARDGAGKSGDAALERRAKLIHARALLRLASPEESERLLAALFEEAEAAGDGALAADCLVARAETARKAAQVERAPALLEAGLARARTLGARRTEVDGLNLQARLEGESGAIEEGLRTLERSLSLAGEIGWLAGEAQALLLKSALLDWKGDGRASFEVAELAVSRVRDTGNREQLLTTLGNLAILRTYYGEFAEAESALVEAESLLAILATPRARAAILRPRGLLQDLRGDVSGSRAAYRAAIAAARETGSQSQVATYLSALAWLELSHDRLAEAEIPAREALALFEAGGDERSALEVGAVLACAAAAKGEVQQARRHIERLRKSAEASDSESARYVVLVGESEIHERIGELPRAIELRRETYRLALAADRPTLVLVQKVALAELLHAAGELPEARRLADEILPDAERIGMADAVRRCRAILASS